MTTLSQDEIRALDRDERELVEASFAPLEGAALSDLIRRLRDRRDRARDMADRQRREARGKADPSGTQPASSDAGMRLKTEVLTAALERATAARDGAGSDGAPDAEALLEAAAKAPGGKPEGIEDDSKSPHDHAGQDQSMLDTTRRQAPSGAFDHSGHAPARERANERR